MPKPLSGATNVDAGPPQKEEKVWGWVVAGPTGDWQAHPPIHCDRSPLPGPALQTDGIFF